MFLSPNPRRTRPRKFCAHNGSLSGASRGRRLVSLSFNPKCSDLLQDNQFPRMFCSQVLKPILRGVGFLNFFLSYSEPVFLPENSLLTLHSNIVPLRNLMEGNIVQYFFHQSHSDIMKFHPHTITISEILWLKESLVQFSLNQSCSAPSSVLL